MTILEKLKTPVAAILAVFFVAALFLVIKIKKLHDNLKVNTHITQDLKHHLDEVAKEDEETKQKLKESQTEVENLNSTLKNLKEENVTAGQRQEALQKLIDDCDKMLRSQNQKIDELEKKLRESQTKLAQQKRQRDAYAEESRNPAATRAYAKLMESEWLNRPALPQE